MSTEELIDNLATKVEGEKDKRDIQIFTLSTCMWCKKCKRYLDEKDIKYSYIDMDKIEYRHKQQIIDFLKATYKERVSYPFLICDSKAIVGYNPSKYDEMLQSGDE